MPGLTMLLNCVSRRGSFAQKKAVKIHFGVTLTRSFSGEELVEPLRDILIYIAREGVSVINLFRRPGNPKETKEIIDHLEHGRPFDVTTFSFYALANVVKKYLLQMPGGLFGESNEQRLLECLSIADEQERIESMSSVIRSLTPVCKQLTAFLFGIWFRMVYHTEVNGMSLEAIAKSVTGSIFHTCNDDPKKVENASKCMELLIGNFSSAALFSADLIEYFTQQTKTNISRTEKYCYEFVYPASVDPNQIETFLRDILSEESAKHGFNYEKDMVSAEEFNAGVSSSTAAQADNDSAVAVTTAPSQLASQKTSTSSNVTVANSNALTTASVGNAADANVNANAACSSSTNSVPARRQASIERSRTSVGTAPQFSGPIGTRLSRIDIGQDLALRRSKTEYGAGVKSVRGSISSPFYCQCDPSGTGNGIPSKSDGELEAVALDGVRLNQREMDTADEVRLHDRQLAEERFQNVRQVQLNRLISRQEWFQTGIDNSQLSAEICEARSTPASPMAEINNLPQNDTKCKDLDQFANVHASGATVERSGSVLSGPAGLETQCILHQVANESANHSTQSIAAANATAEETNRPDQGTSIESEVNHGEARSVSMVRNEVTEAALRRTIEQIPGSETTMVNGECYIKIARYFIVERHYGPDCEQSVQFYQSHFGRTAPQQLSINRHGHEPTKLTTVTEVEVTD